MRILHVCNAARGVPWLCEILREQKSRAHDVSAVIAAGDGPLAATLQQLGVSYHVVPHDPFANADPVAALRAIRGLVALFRTERPDIVQSHLFPSNIATRIAAWIADVPIRLSMNPGPYFLESPVFSEIDVRTAWADTRVIASCEYVRRLYADRGIGADRTALIYYGSDPARFEPARARPAEARNGLGLAPDTPVVGMVAYFYPATPDSPMSPPHLIGRGLKGHDVLLRAVPLVLARVPATQFVLVGDGWGDRGMEYQAAMQDLARTLGVDANVVFTGYRADVTDLLASFDVALQCSLSENVGGAIEALLMERPMVVASTGGLIDAVRHDETGLVVPPDDPPALADAIVSLLTDRVRARTLAARGRALMLERFTAARTAEDLDALYRSLATDPRFHGRPPKESGYRRLRSAGRWLGVPFWITQLAPALLSGITGRRIDSPVVAALVGAGLLMSRVRDIAIACLVLILASPVFLVLWLRNREGPLLVTRTVIGRHGLAFPLWTFAKEPSIEWARRLPWFITLAARRHLALVGPLPEPYEAAAPMARSDPAALRRPGIFVRRVKGGRGPARPSPRSPERHRS